MRCFRSTSLLTAAALLFGAAASAQPAAEAPAGCEAAPPAVPLTVAAALRRLSACNRDIVAARRAVTASAADLRTAGQTQNPTLTAGVGSVSPSAGVGSGPLWRKTVDSSLRLEQLVERGGKRALRVQVAESGGAAARSDLLEVQRQQAVGVVQSLLDVAAADERNALLREVAALQADSQRANEQRVRQGDLAPIDAQRQSIEAAHAQADVLQADAEALHARQALAALLSWEPAAASLQPAPGLLDEPPLPPGVAADAAAEVERRADVAAARARVAAARAARDLAAAQARTDLTVGVQLDHWPTSATNTYGTGNTVSITLGIPLTIGHRFDGELARAISDGDAADENLWRVRAAALAERAKLDADLDSARQRLALLSARQVPQAERVARAAELGYSRGALGLLELLDARRTLRQSRLDLLAARADAARAASARVRWLPSAGDAGLP